MRIALVALFACLVSLPVAGRLAAQETQSSSRLVTQAAYPGMDDVYPVQQVAYADCGSGSCGSSSCGDCGNCGGCGCDSCCGGCGCSGCGKYNVISGCCESCGGGCCGGCCDSCGCGGCGGCGFFQNCCPCGPWVRFRAEVLPLHREVTSDFLDYGSFTTERLDFNHEWSGRASVEFRVHCDHSLEFSYFGLHEWNDDLTRVDPGNLNLRVANPLLATAFVNADMQTVEYVSEIHNGEINYWMPLCCGCCVRSAFMVGARYVSLEEEFEINSLAGANAGSLETETSNNLIHGQIGFTLGVPLWGCLSIRGEGKAGGGVNIASQETEVIPGAGLTPFMEEVDNNAGSWHTDGSVVLSYQVGCNASIYAGYYFMLIEGLALAVDQYNPMFFDPANPNDRGSFIDDNGSVLFQGPVAGFDATW